VYNAKQCNKYKFRNKKYEWVPKKINRNEVMLSGRRIYMLGMITHFQKTYKIGYQRMHYSKNPEVPNE
jgi:hypothetical protein